MPKLMQVRLLDAKAGKQMAYTPHRGDALWLQFNPQTGHEQAGRRPALVLSPAAYNGRVGLAILCPITNHVKSLDWRERKAEYMCTFPDAVVLGVLQRLGALLDPEQ